MKVSLFVGLIAMVRVSADGTLRGVVLPNNKNLEEEKQDSSRGLVMLDHWRFEGCIKVKDGLATPGNSFVMGDCGSQYNHGVDMVWLDEDYQDDGDVIGMVRLRMDPSMCMQATHGGGVLKHGRWMRVYPCDSSNPLQRFHLYGQLRLENTNLCTGFRGGPVIYGEDHVLLKDCNKVWYGWSGD